ncbi:hypothetical protein GENT5_09250 [Flavobacterium ammoniigenes]|jgi:hypothetical protein|uniref:Uncharacterized protein n=1 Tax=Flavobacterium ammoniigenes TaxID=1751095 RepID=A0ABM7V505_9FLAO|nr:hypothetical protein [Flavobacterium ammoniigenes]BDB54620.1 hypothetical protein GENT5_09250 [Flavobacterium ammoniigenes]
MSLYNSERRRFIMGLFIIVLVYSAYYIFFADSENAVTIPRRMRHIIKFSTTILVYLIGSFHLGTLQQKWMRMLWHCIHISLLVTITSIGLYDWTFGMVSNSTKDVAQSMQEFLISPVLYVGMGILNSKYVGFS